MREIKFRAWFEGEMLSNDDLINKDQETHAMYTIITDPKQDDDVIFMQYTGLKVNGDAELYEGDICNVKVHAYHGWKQGTDVFWANAKVIYDSEEMRYRFLAHKDGVWYFVDFDKSVRQKYKILGNVYENPELLEAT